MICSVVRMWRYLFWVMFHIRQFVCAAKEVFNCDACFCKPQGLFGAAVVAVIVYRWKTSSKRSELMLEQSYDIAQSVSGSSPGFPLFAYTCP